MYEYLHQLLKFPCCIVPVEFELAQNKQVTVSLKHERPRVSYEGSGSKEILKRGNQFQMFWTVEKNINAVSNDYYMYSKSQVSYLKGTCVKLWPRVDQSIWQKWKVFSSLSVTALASETPRNLQAGIQPLYYFPLLKNKDGRETVLWNTKAISHTYSTFVLWKNKLTGKQLWMFNTA